MEELLKEYQGILVVAAFLLGGGLVLPVAKRLAAATPTKADDMFVAAVESFMAKCQPEISRMAADELDKLIPDRTLIELVKLRKARWAAVKASKEAAAGGT